MEIIVKLLGIFAKGIKNMEISGNIHVKKKLLN